MQWKTLGIGLLVGTLLSGAVGIFSTGSLWWSGRALEAEHAVALATAHAERDALASARTLQDDRNRLLEAQGQLCEAERQLREQNFGSATAAIAAAAAHVGGVTNTDVGALSTTLDGLDLVPTQDLSEQVRLIQAASHELDAYTKR